MESRVSIICLTPLAQHDFMYNNMIPTMQKVLGEIMELVTTQAGRTILEKEYTMRTMVITNPSESTSWIWNEYYKFLSINGLEKTVFFIIDFPNDTDQLYLLSKYIEYGYKELMPLNLSNFTPPTKAGGNYCQKKYLNSYKRSILSKNIYTSKKPIRCREWVFWYFIVQKLLPDFYSFFWSDIHPVIRLNVEGIVECINVL